MKDNKDSMELIYMEYSKMVYKYLFSLTHNESIAEELMQETFYQAIRCQSRYDKSCKITTWLCAIDGLMDPQREVMYLRLSADLSFREIGEIMGQSENWARVTYYRGKEKLLVEVRRNGS